MIHDLDVHVLDVNATEHGRLVELHREDWDIVQSGEEAEETSTDDQSPKMTTAETLFPDTIKA